MATEEQDLIRWNVPASRALDERVRERIREGGFSSVAEYVRSAVRAELERARDKHLEALLLEGLDSGEGVPVDAEWWAKRRARLVAEAKGRRAGRDAKND